MPALTHEVHMTTTMTPTAEQAFNKVLALRKLSHENQTVTRRSQNAVLQTLNEQDTLSVAEALTQHQAKFGW